MVSQWQTKQLYLHFFSLLLSLIDEFYFALIKRVIPIRFATERTINTSMRIRTRLKFIQALCTQTEEPHRAFRSISTERVRLELQVWPGLNFSFSLSRSDTNYLHWPVKPWIERHLCIFFTNRSSTWQPTGSRLSERQALCSRSRSQATNGTARSIFDSRMFLSLFTRRAVNV